MKLTDADILELNELCNAVVDDAVTEKQRLRLSQWLSTCDEARQYYVRTMGLSASLYDYAAELQSGHPDAAPAGAPPDARPAHRRAWWTAAPLAIAASVALAIWLVRPGSNPAAPVRPTPPQVAHLPPATTVFSHNEFVAQVTGSNNSQWGGPASPPDLGGRLRKGQQIELAAGFAEITFDSGARVVLEGPASLGVDSAWSATLTRGALKASVPPQAIGFRISNPSVEVVDLGTEFSMFADAAGASAEVFVLKGEVEAAPRNLPDQQPLVLREMEGRRFAPTGVTGIDEGAEKFQKFSAPLSLEHFVPPTGYAHWSFDQHDGGPFAVNVSGLALDPQPSLMQVVPKSASEGARTAGRHGGALAFDGSRYAKATFPGLSSETPHTVAFWVKLPKDANLSNAYAMLAWGANNKHFGTHPFHISWNRNPGEGVVGALRTDYARGYALGSTPLRDGQWHHVAVVFIPRQDAERPIEVKQYVDGCLEGEGRPSAPGSDIFMNPTSADAPPTSGTIWLGCRLGIKGVRSERFAGELDELFIADRALQPQEIVRLMNANEL